MRYPCTMNDVDLQQGLNAAINRILDSTSHRKLIVAGPGTGKTLLFRRVLDGGPQPLVLTFINNLKAELDAKLGPKTVVKTDSPSPRLCGCVVDVA
jgi:hypothetical protein